MKADIERKKYHSAKIHKKKKHMDVHLSKELRQKMKIRKRSIGIRKGDRVKIMRGQHAGKEGIVVRASVVDRLIFLEGFTRKNARGKELMLKFQPSNLMLVNLVESKERLKLFGSEVFQRAKQAKAKEQSKEKIVKEISEKKNTEKTVEPIEAGKESEKIIKG